MPSISKSNLKANMLRIFRDIEETGEELIVTDHNRPVLRIQPIAQKKTVKEVFGAMQGKVVYREDVNTPTTGEWGELYAHSSPPMPLSARFIHRQAGSSRSAPIRYPKKIGQ